MGGKSQTSTSEPWPAAQPYILGSLQKTGELDAAGVGPQAYGGHTVARQSDQTRSAVGMDTDVANRGFSALGANFNRAAADTADGGLNALQQKSVGLLSPVAEGKMLQGNPYLQQMIDMTSRDMGNAINLQASGMGRTASGANQGVLARSIGDMATGLRYQNYGDEVARQDAAIGSLFNAGQQQKTNQAGYTGQLMDAFNAYAAPNDLMYRAGANKDDFSQRLLNDDIRLFDDRNNKPLERQSMYNALYSGAGQLGGTQTQKQSSGGGEIAGGLLSLLGLF